MTGFPRLLENLEKPRIYFCSLNTGNSLEFCVKTLNPLEICERHKKNYQHICFFWSKFHHILSSSIFKENYWYLLKMLHRPQKYWNKWEKLLEILFKYTKVFQKYPWKCTVDRLITLEIPLNFLIWDVWEPCMDHVDMLTQFADVHMKWWCTSVGNSCYIQFINIYYLQKKTAQPNKGQIIDIPVQVDREFFFFFLWTVFIF